MATTRGRRYSGRHRMHRYVMMSANPSLRSASKAFSLDVCVSKSSANIKTSTYRHSKWAFSTAATAAAFIRFASRLLGSAQMRQREQLEGCRRYDAGI